MPHTIVGPRLAQKRTFQPRQPDDKNDCVFNALEPLHAFFFSINCLSMRIDDTAIVFEGPWSKLRAFEIAPMVNDLEINSTVSETMIKFSDAITLLSNGMWGGLSRPEPVVTAKKICKKTSIGFGPWRESAGQCLTAATLNGKPTVHAIFTTGARPWPGQKTSKKFTPKISTESVAVPINVLKRLITTRGAIPDHVFRASLKIVDGNAKLLNALVNGVLVIRTSDFEEWYRSERQKGKWPSQRMSLKTRNGRPPNQANAARDKILALVNANAWNRRAGILELHRALTASGEVNVPSADTLDRVVKQLHRETGNPNLMSIQRMRRRSHAFSAKRH